MNENHERLIAGLASAALLAWLIVSGVGPSVQVRSLAELGV